MELLLASAQAAEEVSKTPFYIAGILAAVWAMLLFCVGMTSSTFPGSAALQRGVMAISAILVLATMATAVITA